MKTLWISIFVCLFLAIGCGGTPSPQEEIPCEKNAPPPADPSPKWAVTTIEAEGKGIAPEIYANNPGRAKVMAERAAKTEAIRNLFQQIIALKLDSGRSIQEIVVQDDKLKVHIEGTLEGCEVVQGNYDKESKTYTVKMKLDLSQIWNWLKEYHS